MKKSIIFILLLSFFILTCNKSKNNKTLSQGGKIINSIGKLLPPDAAPLDKQVYKYSVIKKYILIEGFC